jgi:hypothetical protein
VPLSTPHIRPEKKVCGPSTACDDVDLATPLSLNRKARTISSAKKKTKFSNTRSPPPQVPAVPGTRSRGVEPSLQLGVHPGAIRPSRYRIDTIHVYDHEPRFSRWAFRLRGMPLQGALIQNELEAVEGIERPSLRLGVHSGAVAKPRSALFPSTAMVLGYH